MRKVVAVMFAMALFAVPGVASAGGQVFSTELLGANEVPGPGDPDGSGTAVLTINVVYFTLFEVFGGGRTLGKRATGLRVVTDGGGQVGLRASLIRNIIRVLELLALFYMPAIVSVLATRNNQRLGDLAAGTLVVRDTKLESVAGATQTPPVSSERFASWDVTGIGEEEAGAVRSFLAHQTPAREVKRIR